MFFSVFQICGVICFLFYFGEGGGADENFSFFEKAYL